MFPCPTCHGLSASTPLFPPCPDCIGGVANCCEGDQAQPLPSRPNVICACGVKPAGMCTWPNCHSMWAEGGLDAAR